MVRFSSVAHSEVLLALGRAQNSEHLAIFRHGPPGDHDLLLGQQLDDFLVAVRPAVVLRFNQFLDRLKLKKEDVLFASETPEGYLVTPYDPEVEKQVKLGLEFMAKYRDTFRALAK